MSNDGDFSPDEWDPPQLSRPLPFPPPFIVDWSVADTGPIFFIALEGWLFYSGFRRDPWFPSWYMHGYVTFLVLWLLNMLIRPQGRRLLGWVVELRWVPFSVRPGAFVRYIGLWIASRVIWRPVPVRQIRGQLTRAGTALSARVHGRTARAGRLTPLSRQSWRTIMLPQRLGRVLMANVTVGDDGVIDTIGGSGPRWLRWVAAVARGLEPVVALVVVSDTGNLDLHDPEAREGVWAARQQLLVRPTHRMALYLRVRPIDVGEIQRAAGPVASAADLIEWAHTLVERRVLLAIPAATRPILKRRLMALLGVGEQPGTLGRAGLAARPLGEDEVDQLGAEAWGVLFKPSIAINPKSVEVETGDDDPPPLGEAVDQPSAANPGVRRYVTYAVRGLPSRLRVGWTEPLTGRRILCDMAIHITPVADAWAELVLTLKSAWWGGLSLGRDKYTTAAVQARRTLRLIRHRETKALQVGIYASVSATQVPVAELALDEMIGSENYLIPALEQLEARASTEPIGRDRLRKTFWTDSQTVAAAWPGSGGIWVPGCTLIGESARSNEPVGVNLWWEGDETSVMLTLGRSGSGKTNLVQGFVGRMMEPHPEHWLARRPPPAVVAYMKSYDEWAAFCERFHGVHYRLRNQDWREQLASAPMAARIVAFNLIDLAAAEQVTFMQHLNPWVMAHQRGRRKYPLLYVIGEAWAWAQDPQLAPQLKQVALTVRGEGIGLIVDTQFLHHLLESEARDVLSVASVWCAMRMKSREREILQRELDIGVEGMRFLAQIAQTNTLAGGVHVLKGQGIIEAHGLRTTFRMRRFGFESALLDETDPRQHGLREMLGGDEEMDLADSEPLDDDLVMAHSVNGSQLATGGRWVS